MNNTRTCDRCGTVVPANAPDNLCLRCLFDTAVNLDDAEASGAPAATPGNPKLRSVEQNTPPPVFGDYELLGELGHGGQGVVYRARHRGLGRLVALKTIPPAHLAGAHARERFRLEASTASRLDHPNIVPIYEVGERDGFCFYSMELVEGGNLAAQIAHLPFSNEDAARLLIKIAEAIHYAHQHGVLHRDLKPSNILIDDTGPRVTDFGLAKVIEDESGITLSTATLGTPAYMAPEQAAGRAREVSVVADIYSLGAILYEVLTGRPPFQGENALATMRQVIEQEPARPRSLNPGVARDLETICLKCLEKQPAKRYASAEQLAADLRSFLRDEPIQARPVSHTERVWRWCRRKPALATACGVLILLLLVILIGSPLAAYRINRERQRAEVEAAARRGQLYAAEVNLAQDALAEANLNRARQFLVQQRPLPGETNDLRGFEWRYVYGQCRSDELLTLSRSTNPFTAVRFIPNRDWLAATDGDGNVKVWDYRTQKEIFTLPAYTNFARTGHFYERRALDISRDGKTLAVGVGSTIALWDLATRQQTAVLRGHTNTVSQVAFSPDGQTLASGSQDGIARLWRHSAPGPESAPVLIAKDFVYSFAFSDDGVLLALGDASSSVRLWDVSTPAEPRELPPLTGLTSTATDPTFAPGSHRLAAGTGGQIVLWELGAQHEAVSKRSLRDHRSLGVPGAVAFSPDGRMLVSAATDRNLTLWDLSDENREPVKFMGHEAEVNSTVFSPDGRLVASACSDGTVKLWDVSSPWPAPREMVQGDWVYAIAFSPDAKYLASAGQNAKLKLWDVVTEKLVKELDTPAYSLAFSPDGRLLAMHDGPKVRLLEIPSLAEVTNFPGHHLLFSPTGTEVIYFHKGIVHRHNLKTHAERVWKSGWRDVEVRALSPDGQWLAAGEDKGSNRVRVWNTDIPEQPLELASHADRILSLAFSPDGRWLASASWDGTNRLWNLAESRQPVTSFAAHNGEAWAVAFSPDGRTLATGGDDSAIRLWHLASFHQAAALRGHTAPVTVLAFAPDGKHIASGSGDGTVRLWRAPTLEEIAAAEKTKEKRK